MGFQRVPRSVGILLLTALTGCAVVQSQVVGHNKATPNGIVYFMPRRPFVVTVTTPAASTAAPHPQSTVTVTEGTAEPDLKYRFVLSQGTNLIGKSELNITVGKNGLLKTSNSTATSEVATALTNAASSVGSLVGVTAVPPVPRPMGAGAPPPDGCPPPGSSYQYPIYPAPRPGDPQQRVFCGNTVTWHLAAGAAEHYPNNANFTANGADYSGIFYRHELPYVVTVTGPKDRSGYAIVAVKILTSPDDSDIDFFPIKRSFFANNTADITITDGVITGVDQTTDGELTSALSLPATVLSSYTSAIGRILGNLTTNSGDIQKLLAQQQATAIAEAKFAVCRKTIAANPLKGLSGAQLTTAYAAITAACS